MNSKHACIAVLAAAAFAGSGWAALPKRPAPLTKQAWLAQKAQVDAQYQANRKLCDGMKGNTREVCETEAKGRYDALKAELDARYKPSPDASFKAKNVTAEANYAVAKVKCDALKDGAKDRCVKDAKGAREAAIRQAKVERVQETGGAFASGGAAAHKHLQAGAS
jgi:hypothetical protein